MNARGQAHSRQSRFWLRGVLAFLLLGSPLFTSFGQAQELPVFQPIPAQQAAVVFRARTGQAGRVDVVVDGVVVQAEAQATDPYLVFNVPAGTHLVEIRTSFDPTVVISRTLTFQPGQVYAMSFENFQGFGPYRLRLWEGRQAAYDLILSDW